jgi:hypothetical protein
MLSNSRCCILPHAFFERIMVNKKNKKNKWWESRVSILTQNMRESHSHGFLTKLLPTHGSHVSTSGHQMKHRPALLHNQTIKLCDGVSEQVTGASRQLAAFPQVKASKTGAAKK